MELYEVMRTAFSAREFTGDPVPDDVLYRILENARFAPSGGNRQGGHVIIVRDAEKRAALERLMAPTFKRYIAQQRAGESPWNPLAPPGPSAADIEAQRLPPGFLERLAQAPVVLLICVDLGVVAAMDQHLDRVGIISGASIYPLAWNILLAARNEGFGGTLTTFVTAQEPELKDIFNIPDHVAVCALLPIGKPVKQLTKLKRKQVEEFTTIDTFDGPVFGPPTT
jgi:nitroreductase